MKKIITLFVAAILCVCGVRAQWTLSDKDYHIVGQDSIYGQSGLNSLVTPEGNIVLTWAAIPKGMMYTDPNYGYYLHLQMFDKNGNAKFGKDGIIVSDKPSRTYITDYTVNVADNGDLVLSFFDTRNDSAHQDQHVYAYRYNQNGEPVWDKDGIRFNATNTHVMNGFEQDPSLIPSGDNLYFGCYHNEYYKEKADSTNWSPNPWIDDDQMPDFVDVESAEYQLQRLNADGTIAWAKPKIFNVGGAWLFPAENGNLYVVYQSDINGLDAELIDKDGNSVWDGPVTIEDESLDAGNYFPAPTITSDGKGGLSIAYRRLLGWTGYITINHLNADGSVYLDPVSANGTTDGDGSNPVLGTKDGKTLVLWCYEDTEGKKNMMVNEFNLDGSYAWADTLKYGRSLGKNDMWGFKPVKVIPQKDGWVLLYGELTSWNGANFYCEKLDETGKTIWKKQIAENDFKSSSFSVVNADNNAYIFYTCDEEYDSDWNVIPGEGGMRVMMVDISDNISNGINSVRPNGNNSSSVVEYYKVDGTRVKNAASAGVYIVKSGDKVSKFIVK